MNIGGPFLLQDMDGSQYSTAKLAKHSMFVMLAYIYVVCVGFQTVCLISQILVPMLDINNEWPLLFGYYVVLVGDIMELI